MGCVQNGAKGVSEAVNAPGAWSEVQQNCGGDLFQDQFDYFIRNPEARRLLCFTPA